MRVLLTIAAFALAGPTLAAEIAPTSDDVLAFENTRVLGPYVSTTPSGQSVAEFGPNVAVRNAACEKTDRAKVYRCRFETQVSDWGRNDGAWTPREVLLRRDRNGCWRGVG